MLMVFDGISWGCKWDLNMNYKGFLGTIINMKMELINND
jgi:hypothetical protein